MMTLEQADKLQAAVIEQHEARFRLMSAANTDTIHAAASSYIAATDRCNGIMAAIKVTPDPQAQAAHDAQQAETGEQP